jgi:hypothetical protein
VEEQKPLLNVETKARLVMAKNLRDKKAALKGELDNINAQLEALNIELVDWFESNKLKNITLEGIGMFYLNRQLIPTIEEQERDNVYSWLKKEGDYEMLLTFNTMKWRAYYKERLEQGQTLPEGVKQFFQVDVRMRKA